MTDHDDPTATRWPLRGFWRAWYWISWLVSAVLMVVGLGVAVLVWWPPAVPLLLVGALVGWQVGRTARVVELDGAGALTLRRLTGAVRTDAARVHRVRSSVLVSTFTPTVVESADGWAYVIHPRRDRDDLIAALRRHNPTVEVRLRPGA